jgi:hypothetical protein
VSTLERILDVFPPIYAVDEGSVLRELVDSLALELDAYAEDLDRLRRTHWFERAYRLGDLERIAALVGVQRRSWEPLELFRQRVRALVDARLAGSVGPRAVRTFVYEAVRGAESGLGCTLVPGLERRAVATPGDPAGTRANAESLAAAFADPGRDDDDPDRGPWRPLRLVENPARVVRSPALTGRGGLVPYLHRWNDENHGMGPATVTATLTGRSGNRTATPVLANLSTGQAIVYAGVLRVGQRLSLTQAPGQDEAGRRALALLDDSQDVTGRVFSLTGFTLGRPFAREDGDPGGPLLPVQNRGSNRWVYLSAGLFDVRGLDATFFQLADDELREGVFDQTYFDDSLFVSPIAARLDLRWTEHEPAAFTVVVPHGIVALPGSSGQSGPSEQTSGSGGGAVLATEFADGLSADLEALRAAGVRSRLDLRPFTEKQRQLSRVGLPWLVVPPEVGTAGEAVKVGVGGRFSDSAFDRSRFE